MLNRNRVAMMTEKLARRLYGGQTQAIGQKIKLQGLEFDVIGTFKERTQSFGLSEITDENVVIPASVLRYFVPFERVDPLYVSAKTPEDVLPVTRIVRTIIEGRHRPGARYTVDNLAPILDTARVVAALLSGVLIIISAIALLISGVGIMNIMLVTVTERTREIGLRLAVGASKRDVLAQFLTEAVLISLLGGVSGILLGVAPALIVRFLAPEFAIPISGISIAVAFTVSLLVGLIFGLLPARRASKLNPTEALRVSRRPGRAPQPGWLSYSLSIPRADATRAWVAMPMKRPCSTTPTMESILAASDSASSMGPKSQSRM